MIKNFNFQDQGLPKIMSAATEANAVTVAPMFPLGMNGIDDASIDNSSVILIRH
jgi:hypothetical protein